jgi:hypothetical protein
MQDTFQTSILRNFLFTPTNERKRFSNQNNIYTIHYTVIMPYDKIYYQLIASLTDRYTMKYVIQEVQIILQIDIKTLESYKYYSAALQKNNKG